MNDQQSQFHLWQDIGFSAEVTGDGSPTLRLLPRLAEPGKERCESMHHSGGAFSESLYIYGQIIDEAMKKLRDSADGPSVLSVGLGLGYNELLTAAYAIQQDRAEHFYLRSYEVVPGLVWAFLTYCREEKLAEHIFFTYECILEFYEKHFQIDKAQLKKVLIKALEQERWQIRQDFFVDKKEKHQVLLYDAFSGNTDAHLWTEDFLTKSLHQCSGEDALFATYACRSSLKKALKSVGYQVVVRDGFLGKRNSTQGRRGLFQNLI